MSDRNTRKDNPRKDYVINADPATVLAIILAILLIPLILTGIFAQ